ncbi:MAG: 50S ribosomal protein L32e [Desulfurococcales archaeon]|nr:50S ribosomal protein L32e [Desulfurococcales archaeon]
MPSRSEELRRKRILQRKLAKRKDKPRFLRYLSWRFWKFERREYWRKPKGNDNKMRLQIKGYPPIVKSGYGTERSIRGLHPSGLEPVIIHNKNDLARVDPKRQIAYIASTVGLRKRLEIIEEAKKLGVRLANAGV